METEHVDDDDVVEHWVTEAGALLSHELEGGLHHPQAVVQDLVLAHTGQETCGQHQSHLPRRKQFLPWMSTLPIGIIQTGLPELSNPARPPEII